MGKLVMGYWDCPVCGTKGIPGNTVNCPSCGRARGEVKFYMKNVEEGAVREANERGDIEYLTEEQAKYVSKNPDWYCSFCNSLNSDNAQFCSNCGASRADSESNYFEMLKKKEERDRAEAAAQAASSAQPVRKSRGPLLILAVIALIIVGVVLFLNGKKTTGDLNVTALSWARNINIEQNTRYSESAWQLPNGAELTGQKQEIHHYDNVVDHYENREVRRSREVIDGYETYYTYTDMGNGAFEEVAHERPKYRTEYYTETVREPVYRQVARYATKYYYDIWRWVPERDISASGTDHNAVWPDVELQENEREGKRSEEYRFTVENPKKNTSATYSLAEADWQNINVGDSLSITSKRTGGDAYISDEKGNRIADIRAVK